MCLQGEEASTLLVNLTPTPNPASNPPPCVPTDQISLAAYIVAASNLPPAILNHSLRVYVLAHALAASEHSTWSTTTKLPLLFTACILHDIGCAAIYDGPQRFEVCGADAAADLLTNTNFNVSVEDIHEVWTAIALHTSPGIAERISDLARIVRTAVLIDFGKSRSSFNSMLTDAEREFPRLQIEKVLGDTVVAQALREVEGMGMGMGMRKEKAPAASWPGILVRAKKENPGWEGVNKAF